MSEILWGVTGLVVGLILLVFGLLPLLVWRDFKVGYKEYLRNLLKGD